MNKLVNISWLITILIGLGLLVAAGMQRFTNAQNTEMIIILAIVFTLAFVISLLLSSFRSYSQSEEYKETHNK